MGSGPSWRAAPPAFGPVPASPTGPAPVPPPASRRLAYIATGVVCATLVAAVVVLAVGGDNGRGSLADRSSSGPGDEVAGAELDGDASPAEVFAHAARVLEEAGTFSYEGSRRVEGPGPVDGYASLVTERSVTGDVVLPDALREAVDDPVGLYSERISIGSGTAAQSWTRSTAYPDQLRQRPWGQLEEVAGELDLYLLPAWLDGAIDHREGGEDANGQRVVHAGVPPRLLNDLGPGMDVIDVAVELTLGDGDEPQQVALTISTLDTVIESTYELNGLGSDISVDAPEAHQLDATPWFNEEDLATFEGPTPLGLSAVPEGWEVTEAYVQPAGLDGPASLGGSDDCASASASVAYADLDNPGGEFLWLVVRAAGCTPVPAGEPLDVAGFTGATVDAGDGSRWGVLVADGTVVEFYTDLSVGDLKLVLATLGPLDLAATPSPLPGIPSGGT